MERAFEGMAGRVLTHVTRRQRIMARWLDELDSFYDLLILHRVSLIELGILNDLQDRAKKMLRIATEEAEVGADLSEEFESLINLRVGHEQESI